MTALQDASPLAGLELAGDDRLVPFSVAPLDVRGRAIQLGPMLDAILARHAYPEPVARLLGEAVALTVLLGSSLKFEGRLIVQAQGEGPVSLLVVDYRTPGHLRGYARFDEDGVARAKAAGQVTASALMGGGVLALTIDQGAHMQRYQGVVSLDGVTLEQAAEGYFRQSEQLPTAIRLAAAPIWQTGAAGRVTWRAGGLIAQFLPKSGERLPPRDLPGGDAPEGAEPETPEDDAWTEAKALVATVADDELLDPGIGAERLLFRLFYERGVHVHAGERVHDRCSCSREKIVDVLRSLPEDDRRHAARDGLITTTCEFCNSVYEVPLDEVSTRD